MAGLIFQKLDPFSFLCQLDGALIGVVVYSPTVYYSWSFRNAQGNVMTFGSTKYQAVKNYVSFFLEVGNDGK